MCGIGSITLSKTASPSLNARLDHATTVLLNKLDHRGGDACGLLSIRHDGRAHVTKAPCDANDFNAGRGTIPAGTRAIAVHTRFATSGAAHWNRNNHPVACNGTLVIHNGVIWDTRRPSDIPHPTPEVDTYLLAQAADSQATKHEDETTQQHAERIALKMAHEDGSAAVIVALKGQPLLITAALHESPLYHAEAEGVRVTASTYDAVRDTFKALALTLPPIPYTYTKIVKKAKKGRPAVTKQVSSTREAIHLAEDGDILTWHAGTHTNSHILVPLQYQAARSWQASGIDWTYAKDNDQADANYAAIASKLLNTDDQWHRCDMCDDWTHEEELSQLFGGRICTLCKAEVETDIRDAAQTTPLERSN